MVLAGILETLMNLKFCQIVSVYEDIHYVILKVNTQFPALQLLTLVSPSRYFYGLFLKVLELNGFSISICFYDIF